MVRIADRIYGVYEIDNVLEELIESKPVQRLKGIHQGGASYLINSRWNVTRFDHSVGVMLLIKRLGGSIEEQIAGLLHDVSHTAFSHVIDFVLDNKDEDYHEKIYTSVVQNSEIPSILEKYGYNYKDILQDDSKWTLLEQPAPELCADRVDYTLRDMYEYGHISLEEVHRFLDHLIVVEGKMYVQNTDIAEWFVRTYYKEVIDFFMDPLNIYGNGMLAKILKISIDKGIISLDDFLMEDDELIDKIKSVEDKELVTLLEKLNQNVQVIEDRDQYDIHLKNKVRMIDPSVWSDNRLIPASELSNEIRNMSKEAFDKATRGVYLRIISN